MMGALQEQKPNTTVSYGESYECVVPNHEELELLFQEKCNNYGILYRMSDIIQEYQTAYDLKQLSLFDFISE